MFESFRRLAGIILFGVATLAHAADTTDHTQTAFWATIGSAFVALIALVAPWVTLRRAGRWPAVANAAVLAAISTSVGYFAVSVEQHNLLVFGLPLALAWLLTAGLFFWAVAGHFSTRRAAAWFLSIVVIVAFAWVLSVY